MVAIVWFRRDLRVHDHPALRAALAGHDRVLPVFCLDDRLLRGRNASGVRTQFLLECLADLDRQLTARGGGLIIRRGPPEMELPALARATGATEVHVTADGSPYDQRRGERVNAALAAAGVAVRAHPGQHTADDAGAILTLAGRPYTVFSPYYRNWARTPRRAPLAAPDRVPLPAGPAAGGAGAGGAGGAGTGGAGAGGPRGGGEGAGGAGGPRRGGEGAGDAGGPRRGGEGAGDAGGSVAGGLPTLREIGLTSEVPSPMPGGETAGIARLEAFLAGPAARYAENRNLASPAGFSRLSPYLRFGCLSARAVEAQLPDGEAGTALRRQLCWRDFYHQLLSNFPGNAHEEFQERYRHRLAWNTDEQGYTAWTQGRTGFPLVDAGMRQLRREGWLPGPVRLVVACFLVKDLGIDWRRGEAHFMRLLLDGDEAVNNGNWQWISSVGVDRQPPARRLYNPARQQERQDPDGRYVRGYLPELTRVPREYLSEPWRMPPDVQRKAGCRIGDDYPAPLVDHSTARAAAIDRYHAAWYATSGAIPPPPPPGAR